MTPRRLFIIIAIILLCLPFAARAQSLLPKYDSALKWRSIKTPHFRIHYHQGLQGAAERLSVISERVYDKLTAGIGWKPLLRTDVILNDITDSANGNATPILFNRVELYIVRPEPDDETANFNDWLETVFTHEFTHVLQLDMAFGFPRWARYVLGRVPLFFPNIYVPVFVIEGNAVYHESEGPGLGRNNSTLTHMVLRTDAGNDGLKSIDKAANFPREWPQGRVPYLYGGLFVQYLEETRGRGSFARYLHENADNIIPYSDFIYPIPYFFNKDVKDVYGKSFHRLWEEWQVAQYEKYLPQIRDIHREGVTGLRLLSPEADSARYPRFSPDGTSLFYVRTSRRRGEFLVRYDLPKSREVRLCRVNAPNSVAPGPDGSVYLSDNELYRSYSEYSELFVYRKGYRRMSARLRSRSLDHFHSSGRIVYVASNNGRYSLLASDTGLANRTTLIGETEVQLSFPRVSPDDTRVVFTMKSGRGSDLALLDLASLRVSRLTGDEHNDLHPAWHPDGNRIVFSSDRSGVFNLYEYDLAAGTITRLTNLVGGAFDPDVSPDGRSIALTSYEKNGYRVALMAYRSAAEKKEKGTMAPLEATFFTPAAAGEPAAGGAPENTRYTPAHSVFPAFVIPLIYASTYAPDGSFDVGFGFYTLGMDTLFHHRYQIQALIFPIQQRLTLGASYTYAGLYPDITFGYFDDAIVYGEDPFPWRHDFGVSFSRIRTRSGYFELLIPLLYYQHRHYFTVTYRFEQDLYDTWYPDDTTSHEQALLGGVLLGYFFTCTHRYPYSISKEDGREFSLIGEINHRYLGSDHSYYKLKARYDEYLPGFAANNVILLGLRGAVALNYPAALLLPFDMGEYPVVELPLGSAGVSGVRGYAGGVVFGDRLLVGAAEYRLPLYQADAGPWTVPLMFRDLWMKLYCQYGGVWQGAPSIRDFRTGIGAELHTVFTAGFEIDLDFMVGYAYGFNRFGEHQVYFSLGGYLWGKFSGCK